MSNTAPTQTNLSTTLSNFEGAQAPANGASTAGYALTNSVFITGYSDSDGNPNGIAITSVDNTKGLLWYSLDSGANWTPVSGVSANHALLLSGATTRLYYQAKQTADGNLNYNGLNTGVLTYRAWDQTSGSNGSYGDTTVNGGTSAFSAVERSVDGLMVDVNDAPTLALTKVQALINHANPVHVFTNAVVGTGQGDTGDNALMKQLTLTVKGVKNAAVESLGIDGFTIPLVAQPTNTPFPTQANTFYKVTLVGTTATLTLSNTDGWQATQVGSLLEGITYRNTGASNTALTDGVRQIAVTSLTDKGLTNTPSNPYAGLNYTVFNDPLLTSTVTVDKTAPATPTAPSSYVDNVGSLLSPVSTASATDDATPGVLIGTNISDTPRLYVDGINVAATYDSTTGTLTPSVPLTSANSVGGAGTPHSLTYTLTDAAGNESAQSPAYSLTINTVNDAPTGSVSVSGTSAVGQLLTASATFSDIDGPVSGVSYQWEAQTSTGTWTPINGATANTYTLTANEQGQAVRVVVHYSDGVFLNDVASTATALVPYLPINLATLGTQGMRITGEGGKGGWVVSQAGDVNGDHIDDVLIGAPDYNGSGRAYVVFGQSGVGASLNLANLGSRGFAINGDFASHLGYSASGLGDLNGDGLSDVLVGAYEAMGEFGLLKAGQSYVIYGKSDTNAVNVNTLAATGAGVTIYGTMSNERSSYSLSGAGDVNNDGMVDMVIGAPYSGLLNAGRAYVAFGQLGAGTVYLSNFAQNNTPNGFMIDGSVGMDNLGYSVSGVGDLNGDHYDDIVVSAPGTGGTDAGRCYVVFGKMDTTAVNVADLVSGVGGFIINGQSAYDQLGTSVSEAGDVNGDGLRDVIVSATYADPNGHISAGRSYVVFGKTDNNAVNLSSLGTSGFVINGINAGDNSGQCVSYAGDFNGDGLADLLVGAPGADVTSVNANNGQVFLVFGKTGNTAVNLSDVASGHGGLVINGANAAELAGWSVSSAGDVNADGYGDLLVGAPGLNGSAGGVYVIYGGSQYQSAEALVTPPPVMLVGV